MEIKVEAWCRHATRLLLMQQVEGEEPGVVACSEPGCANRVELEVVVPEA